MLGSAREQRPQAIRPSNYFRRIPTYVITVPERYTQTDGRTDASEVIRHTCAIQIRLLLLLLLLLCQTDNMIAIPRFALKCIAR